MNVLLILILASLGVALLFLAAFIWSVRSGQYEDTLTPSMRMLTDDVAAGVSPAVEPGVPPGGQNAPQFKRFKNNQNASKNPSLVPGGRMPPSTSGGTPDATIQKNPEIK